jgi:hypothetical protein
MLGPEGFEAALAAGRALSDDDAAGLALTAAGDALKTGEARPTT